MSLKVFDEEGNLIKVEGVEEGILLETKHDGTRGESVDRLLMVTNDSVGYDFERVVAKQAPSSHVTILFSIDEGGLEDGKNELDLPDFPAQTSRPLHVRITVPLGTEEGNIAESGLVLDWVRFRR